MGIARLYVVACGACHILAHAFLERYGAEPFKAVWLKPAAGFTGNHIVIDGGARIFDYHGYSRREAFFAHTQRTMVAWMDGEPD